MLLYTAHNYETAIVESVQYTVACAELADYAVCAVMQLVCTVVQCTVALSCEL